MNIKFSAYIRLVAFFALTSLTCSNSWAQFQDWTPTGQEVEFGITALINSTTIDEPWVFESGYSGAWWFDDNRVMGQTFSVSTDRLLKSISARVGNLGPNPPFGTLEVGIYEFNEESKETTSRLAFAIEDAVLFDYELDATPITTFDLSGFGAILRSDQTYMLTFRTTPSSSRLQVQSATDIYDGGEAYIGTVFSIREVAIDIKPGNRKNVINPRAQGGIWVAILSDTDTQSPFDPSSQVDIPTVEFGPDGAKTNRYEVKDINKDGLGDLLLRFKIPKTGIACGDTEVMLVGKTFDGQSFSDADAIKTVGCK